MTISTRLRLFAEEPEPSFVDVPPLPMRRFLTPRYSLVATPSPTETLTSAVRTTAEELDATVEEVRATLREVGFSGNVWQVGPSCQPEGLAQRLVQRGFRPVERAPYEDKMAVMALEQPPPLPPAGTTSVRASLVDNLDQYVVALRVALEAFNESEENAAAWMAAAPALWQSQNGTTRFTHIATLDDKPVGVGFSQASAAGVMLSGSGVLASARGRGVYRTLVAARWAEAQRLGITGLAVHAGVMSRPILERCGFEYVCELELYDDLRFRASAPALSAPRMS